MNKNEYLLYPDDRSAMICVIVFFGPFLVIDFAIAFAMDSLALNYLFVLLAVVMVWIVSCTLKRANTKLILAEGTVSIVNGRKTILPAASLRDFKAVYFLDLTWRYTGKYRIGDPIGKEVWNSQYYCLFSKEEISDEVMNEIAHRLRKQRPCGLILEGLVFARDTKFFPLMKTYISEDSVIYEKRITLKPGAY